MMEPGKYYVLRNSAGFYWLAATNDFTAVDHLFGTIVTADFPDLPPLEGVTAEEITDEEFGKIFNQIWTDQLMPNRSGPAQTKRQNRKGQDDK